MKIGIKTYSSEKFLEYFKENADFFEIMAIESNDYNFLKKFSQPIIIHAQHQSFNINNADKLKNKINLSSINFARKLADLANAKRIIVHPGELWYNGPSVEQSIEFIRNINDKRVIVENMPSGNELCSYPQETKGFLKQTNKGLCLDINHAIEAAIYYDKDYIGFLKEFIKLKPAHYHLGGQKIKEGKTHLSLKESDFDLKKVLKIIPRNANITLETIANLEKTQEDIDIIKKIIEEI
ncbi:Uncharacterised protein [uncultured archaeon]|nr:Uncharacterised protein [uncultured archaeon]